MQVRSFSWKSRLKKDPDLRLKKLEALNRRYSLRRLGELPDETPKLLLGEPVLSQCRREVKKRIEVVTHRLKRFSNLSTVDRVDLEETSMGEAHQVRDYIISIQQPNPRTAVVVVKDRGNTERILKSLKSKHPNFLVTLMDRERIQVALPRITKEFRELRGKHVNDEITKAKKELRKLELQSFRDLEKMTLNRFEFLQWRERVAIEIKNTEPILETLLADALENLELEIR